MLACFCRLWRFGRTREPRAPTSYRYNDESQAKCDADADNYSYHLASHGQHDSDRLADMERMAAGTRPDGAYGALRGLDNRTTLVVTCLDWGNIGHAPWNCTRIFSGFHLFHGPIDGV
jgi:hypothetical protein